MANVPPPVTCRVCGHPLGPWSALACIGHMDLLEDDDRRVELRNCPACSATHAIDLGAPPPSLALLSLVMFGVAS